MSHMFRVMVQNGGCWLQSCWPKSDHGTDATIRSWLRIENATTRMVFLRQIFHIILNPTCFIALICAAEPTPDVASDHVRTNETKTPNLQYAPHVLTPSGPFLLSFLNRLERWIFNCLAAQRKNSRSQETAHWQANIHGRSDALIRLRPVEVSICFPSFLTLVQKPLVIQLFRLSKLKNSVPIVPCKTIPSPRRSDRLW